MSATNAAIDWYVDGFEARLEGSGPFSTEAFAVSFAAMAVGVLGPAILLSSPAQGELASIIPLFGGSILLSLGLAIFGAVSHERRPVRVLAVGPHQLEIRRTGSDVLYQVALEDITHVALNGTTLLVHTRSGDAQIDASTHSASSLEGVVEAVRHAVEARRVTETDEDRQRREQALQALEALRTAR